ncbi:MAG: hypothetical protein FWH01_12980 [Oscillospiraceae bacterium]|nr:hypothetical protein [Oscillospiraceae bacterium]
MILTGRIVKGHKTVYRKDFKDTCEPGADFRDKLESCLLGLCKDADIPAPMWLGKNSSELGMFSKTDFHADQFAEPVKFDRFEIKITER